MMSFGPPRAAVALAFFACLVAPAWSLDWGAEQVAQYGGSYAVDCRDAAALKLRVATEGLVIEVGSRRITGREVQTAFSYFGQSPPPEFQVALLGKVKGNIDLTFLVFRDKQGRYLQMQADPKLMSALGARADGETRFRDCDAGRRLSDGAAAQQDARDTARAEQDAALASPLADPRFKSAYYGALGPRVRQSWLARLDGPSPGPKNVVVAGNAYLRLTFCKPHDCHDNSALLLYSKTSGALYGLVVEQGVKSTLIGRPPGPVADELKRLWQAEWRSQAR
jgi:hypothetical protein